MGKKSNANNISNGYNRKKKFDREIRENSVIARENEENDESDNDNGDGSLKGSLSIKIYLWEFGQNDPKRDSGSKMCRLGYASKLRIGQSFPGIVLSSEATFYVNPTDRDIVAQYGIAGINCSWNRLEEIPFDSMGKGRNQRLLPLLFAANSVNYGRPYKMNTAEATAACLYITGFKEDAELLLSPFGYGSEFLRLNYDALEAYSRCTNTEDVQKVIDGYVSQDTAKRLAKESKLAREVEGRSGNCNGGGVIGGYMDDMDLPPSYSSDEYDYNSDEADEAGDI